MFFSIIIPLYNRPQEIDELLQALTQQEYTSFEVIIVEDGSSQPAEAIVERYRSLLTVHYFKKENEGQGFARNYGFSKAKGDYFIVFDSDILVPKDYLTKVLTGLERDKWDAFGGPDAAHSSFTPIQKAISYAMTSPFTTGGIRGNKKHVGTFHPRSFNMGLSREVYNRTGGFKLSRRSEDIEFSIRMLAAGFKVGLISEAFVYHKRRANYTAFFKQTHQFGKGRIDIFCLYPKELKPVHTLPTWFFIGFSALVFLNMVQLILYKVVPVMAFITNLGNGILGVYTVLLAVHAWRTTKSLGVALRSVLAAYTQLLAYGSGFLIAYLERSGKGVR